MKSVLLRTGSGSIPVQPPVALGSSRSVPLRDWINCRSIRRVSSESDVIRSAIEGSSVTRKLSKLRSTSFPAIIPEEDCDELTEDRRSYARDPIDELGFTGGGIGKNRKLGGGSGGGSGNSDPKKIGEYYKEMLKSDPTNSLLLRNYGKYLHEVERDYVKAEEYYGRAILASPGDGEVLSLYGKLVWESKRDESRARSYFDQAVHASPDDCTVLGSYAHFMWEADEDDNEPEELESERVAAMVAAY